MSRKITVRTRPSIADLIRHAADVDQLAALRSSVAHALIADKLDPQDRTVRTWRENIWLRLCELLASAATPGECHYTYSVTFRWYQSDAVRQALWQIMAQRVAQLPDDVTRLRLAGIEIVGLRTA